VAELSCSCCAPELRATWSEVPSADVSAADLRQPSDVCHNPLSVRKARGKNTISFNNNNINGQRNWTRWAIYNQMISLHFSNIPPFLSSRLGYFQFLWTCSADHWIHWEHDVSSPTDLSAAAIWSWCDSLCDIKSTYNQHHTKDGRIHNLVSQKI